MTLYLVALRSNKLEWMKLIGDCINYIEDNIKEDINASVIAKRIEYFYFLSSKGFYYDLWNYNWRIYKK